jgi:hypothetical protein
MELNGGRCFSINEICGCSKKNVGLWWQTGVLHSHTNMTRCKNRLSPYHCYLHAFINFFFGKLHFFSCCNISVIFDNLPTKLAFAKRICKLQPMSFKFVRWKKTRLWFMRYMCRVKLYRTHNSHWNTKLFHADFVFQFKRASSTFRITRHYTMSDPRSN